MHHPINVRLPQRLLDWLDRQAGDTSTRSQVIRDLIHDAATKQADHAPTQGRR